VSVRESEQLICDSDSVEHFALYITDIEVFDDLSDDSDNNVLTDNL
jgi:hypothetical protein